MLWIKAFHIILVTSWFAGLFYLPRIYVNLAMVTGEEERSRLLLMSHKLYRFVTPIAGLALLTGLWLWFGYGFAGVWLHIKVSLVVILVAYHFYCGKILTDFKQGTEKHSHVWFRFFNEIPVIILLIVVILVTVKPL
jgi:putative membrane protein